jgi:carbonic anhydrase
VRRLTGLILSAALLLPGAAPAAGDAKKPAPKPWHYFTGANNDEGWEELSPDYAKCKYGDRQSPVLLHNTKQSAMPPLAIQYRQSSIRMEKKDRTMVIDVTGRNTLKDEGKTYTLTQMRIHVPAEHQTLEVLNPMELQLIHKDAGGKLLIMSIFGTRGDTDHPGLQAILDKAPGIVGKVVKAPFNPQSLLPEANGYYAYSGSLSWPPCTEGVEWRIRKQPISISKAQMKKMGQLFGRNARLQQPHYMRPIRETLF